MSLDSFIKKIEDDSFYYSDYEFVTNSQLGLIKKDVRTYKLRRAYHVAMLEPNEFNDKVKVFDSATRTTKGYKEFKAENSKAPTIILTKEYDQIMRMQDVLFSHKEVKDLLVAEGEREIANAWQDDDTGVFCKGKADYRKFLSERMGLSRPTLFKYLDTPEEFKIKHFKKIVKYLDITEREALINYFIKS